MYVCEHERAEISYYGELHDTISSPWTGKMKYNTQIYVLIYKYSYVLYSCYFIKKKMFAYSSYSIKPALTAKHMLQEL